jgi:hypothetical protein
MRRGKGWQSREIKLKELKHEGHIAPGKIKQPMKSHAAIYGMLFCFCNLLARVYKVRSPFLGLSLWTGVC